MTILGEVDDYDNMDPFVESRKKYGADNLLHSADVLVYVLITEVLLTNFMFCSGKLITHRSHTCVHVTITHRNCQG